MAADRVVSVLGLGFGDCGKGLVTDALVRRLGARLVVRFNGGAQAGHTVVLPDGRRHTFSQFGAGSFSAGVRTLLARPVVVHPTALLEEAAVLERCGVGDAFERLRVDPRCRVTTPFHQAAGRLREWARGSAAHGSCGAGFGETVDHALRHGDEALHWGDLADREHSLASLEAIRARLRNEIAPLRDAARAATPAAGAEAALLDRDDIAARWLDRARVAWARAATPLERALGELSAPGTLILEGAQGILLDERHGFHPHTTWSSTGGAAADAVLAEAGRPPPVQHIGVIRSYLTRHGAGPLPTEDPALDALAEPDNGDHGWQGRFRRGHFDAVLLRHALAGVGPLAGIAVTHLDAFARGPRLRWCDAYRHGGNELDRLDRDDAGNGVPSDRLARLLRAATPLYDAAHLTAPLLRERIEALAGVPVVLESSGPTSQSARLLGCLA